MFSGLEVLAGRLSNAIAASVAPQSLQKHPRTSPLALQTGKGANDLRTRYLNASVAAFGFTFPPQ